MMSIQCQWKASIVWKWLMAGNVIEIRDDYSMTIIVNDGYQ